MNAIEKSSRLSYGQKALWYLNQTEPASNAYHLGICLRMSGSVNEHALASAWADIVMAHPQLRARFVHSEGQPAVRIEPWPESLRVETGGEAEVHRWWKQTAGRPFALASEAPVRALLLRDANRPVHLLLCMHHIVGDLWSSAVLLHELSAAYQARAAGTGEDSVVPCERFDYAEFAEMESRWVEGPQGLAAWNFWREQLRDLNTEPVFAPGGDRGQCGEVEVVLDPAEALLVHRAARERRTTPYAVLLATYARLLAERTGRSEVIIGTPAVTRHCAALRNTVGYLVNSVPMRCPAGRHDGDFLSAVATNVRRALEHRRFPFAALVERLRFPRNLRTSALFESMFAYQSLPRAHRDLLELALTSGGTRWNFADGVVAETISMPPFDPQFPLALTLGPSGEGFSGRLHYDGRSVGLAEATRLGARFPELLGELLAPRRCRSSINSPHTPAERLEELFDEAARRTPNANALSEPGLELTYGETKARSEAFASSLEIACVGKAGPVAIQMPSCAEAVVLILAVLKSGRAFQPIDPTEPTARRNAALQQTRACALLLPNGVAPGTVPPGVVTLTPEKLTALPQSTAPLHSRPQSQTAYLIYTSGSTGQPKAVEVSHASVINHARAMTRIFDLTSRDRVLQFHTLAFDAALEEIFPAWVAGAQIVFEPHVRELAAPAFLEALAERGVTVLNLPTSYWRTLTGEAHRMNLLVSPSLRLLVVGGEQASWETYCEWRRLAPQCRWINTYGPTEATITALSYEPPPNVSARGILPIGRPIEGVTAMVLKDTGEQIHSGEGELLLGGKGLATGYWGDAATTAEKFVMREVAGQQQRFYRTGDRVNLRDDGNFEYLGRLDRQLKIRGHRINPEEIEHALRTCAGVTDAVVVAEEIQGNLNLTGWVARVNGAPTERALRSHASACLPPYMIPSRLMFVRRIPRKPSGKVDTSTLVRPRPSRTNRTRSGPREMANLFSELLHCEMGLHEDFFVAGGHSLLVLQLLGRVEARWGVRIPASDFFTTPTPAGLWKLVHGAPSRDVAVLEESISAETSISSQQERALLGHRIGSPSIGNIIVLLRVDGEFDMGALQRAVETVASRNSLLRCGFIQRENGIVLQEAADLPTVEHRTLDATDTRRAVIHLAQQEGSKPFALDGRHPWFRMLLVSDKAQASHLVLITHHAVADGWACRLLMDDLRVEYRGIRGGTGEPVPRALDYRIYARHQAQWLRSPAAREQATFWRQRLSGAEEPRLPFRRPSGVSSWQIDRREVNLPAGLSHKFRRIARSYGVTPFALAMACFKALVHRYNGQRDIVLGTVVSNRSAESHRGIRGPLQNPVLIRDTVTSGLRIETLARRTAHSIGEAERNGALPIEQVIREAQLQLSPHGGIQFLSHDRSSSVLQLGSATLRPVEVPSEQSPFDLTVAVSTGASRLKITLEYRPSIYPTSGINHLSRQYAALLKSVVTTPQATVGELDVTPADERRAFERRISKTHQPCGELLHEGFATQACKRPNAIAIASAERRLTYGELHSMSDATASALLERGLKPGGLVAVMLKKGWEQVVACLAVLKAGGTYVPLDPNLPAARLEAILDQGGFHGAIVADATPQPMASWTTRLRFLITVHTRPTSHVAPPRLRIKPDALGYIIFTSGTTGVPKGVMISHEAAMTTIREMHRRFQPGAGDRVLAVSSLGFDLSVFDIFGTLRAGGTIVMPTSEDPAEWAELVRKEQVTVWNSVPCLFELLLDEATARSTALESLRLILLSGDFVSPTLANRARRMLPYSRFVALGGATEAAIWSIAHEVEGSHLTGQNVPYGRPLRGQEMFVLDSDLNHCATGVAGELFIAGAGLAAGYWRNPAESKRQFRLHPRRRVRLYRTGDQGRYLENGEIEILGRLDTQVKVNGMRLELGEIEAALRSMPATRQAVADVCIDASGNRRLTAFVALQPGTDERQLSTHMANLLPAGLRPSAYVLLDRLPVTATGKVDRNALRAMSVSSATNTVATPANPTERRIMQIWSALLGDVTVGPDDDFFSLGGHSLLAIQMLQRVRSEFDIELPVSSVLDHPTVREMAAAVDAAITFRPKAGLPRRTTAELEHNSEPEMPRPAPARRRHGRSDAVLLTGATGHLGSTLLLELLENTTDRIYCLVRAGSEQEAEARVAKALQPHSVEADLLGRVVAVPADLSREQLGLTSASFADMARDIRAAYHCAAEVNFMASYEKLAASNVTGVREMIRLVATGGAVLHHVSSVAVFPYGGRQTVHEDEDITAVGALMGGYAQSKWTSERMVWKAIEKGLRAVIYRPAQIIGPERGDQSQDLFHQVLRACHLLRAVPDIDATIDLVTSDYAASAIRCLSGRESSLGKAFHLVHPEPVSLREFVHLFPEPLPLVPLGSWMEQMRRQSEHSPDSSLQFISLLAQGLERADLTPPSFDCSNTVAGLHGTGVICPPLDRSIVRHVF